MTAPRTVVSIELLLDPLTEQRVRSDWERLAAAGLSSLAVHTSASNRPHVTLLARPVLTSTDYARACELLPIPVRLGDPVTFVHGDRAVFARPVEVSEDLSALHRLVHTLSGPGDDMPHTAPGGWTPHVTLARRLRLDALDTARSLVAAPYAGTATHARRWDSAAALVTPLG